MERPSQEFDEKLFGLKMAQALPQICGTEPDLVPLEEVLRIRELSDGHRDKREVQDEQWGVRALDRCFARLREHLKTSDRIAREVWQIQGERVTSDFVRQILLPKAMALVNAWLSKHSHTSVARRPQDAYPSRFRQIAIAEVPKLMKEVSEKYEIEALTLEHKFLRDPAAWHSRCEECKNFAAEESQIIRAIRKDRLFADCEFDSSLTFEKATVLRLREGPDQRLKAEFESWATKAGIALGSPRDASPLEFWLCKLFLYLEKNRSPHLFAPDGCTTIGGEIVFTAGGIITNVWEASATFCLWLEKQALEARHGSTELVQKSGKTALSSESESTNTASRIGQNIDALRLECGWSFDKLAEETGIDKKLILSHVNKGAKPIPRILKEYAQAFSKKLGRNIIAPDLKK